jgi:aerobic C4-dicarboxylate transport protein
MVEATTGAKRKPFYTVLYVQVLAAIVAGAIVGWLYPEFATQPWIKALGDGFIKLIKLTIGPIIFCTIVSGVARVGKAAKVGSIAVKALVYFEVVSTVALAIGLAAGNYFQLGHSLAGAQGDVKATESFAEKAHEMSLVDFVLNIIPDTLIGPFAKGDILQILLISIFFAFALMAMGPSGERLRSVIDDIAHAIFKMLAIILRAAPIGAFGAMAFTIGKFGPAALGNLAGLIGLFYGTSLLFIIVVLGTIAALAGFSIFKFIVYLREEILLVVGTSSSESALSPMMEKLQSMGVSKSVVGLVTPLGYSFNLDGTNIYMTLATLFIAQAMGVHLDLTQQLTILVVAMLTSKGASGVTGAGFITLAATLAAVDPRLTPGMAIVFAIDKFMSECRALTNLIGNGVAAVVVGAWEGELDRGKLKAALNGAPRLTPTTATAAD